MRIGPTTTSRPPSGLAAHDKESNMAQENTVAGWLHDLGLAAWFGGSLMGAVGLNGAASSVEEPEQRLGWPTPAGRAGPR
jgi:hypothetical protein